MRLRPNAQSVLRDLLPPALLRLARQVRPPRYGFFGCFATYEEAAAAAGGQGYVDPALVASLLRIQRSHGVDDGPVPVEESLFHLQLAVSSALGGVQDGELRVLDFGGGPGKHYFDLVRLRTKGFWPTVRFRWDVCETEALVTASRLEFSNEELRFHDSLNQLTDGRYDLVYASGSLQCVPDADATWDRLVAVPHRWLALNRFPLIAGEADALAVQRAWIPGVASARYPGRFFAEGPWLARAAATHDIVARWDVLGDRPYVQSDAIRDVRFSGFLLRNRRP